MRKRAAQGAVEYLLMSALAIIILVWAVHHLIGASGRAAELADALSSADSELNRRAVSEIISNINSS
jgi:hypothetical protein